jgi:putative tryptophan/tyrosine transport system substrate-binding protein
MTKRNLGSFAVCAMLFALCSSAEAQQPTKVPRIGYLSPLDPAADSTRSEAIRLALRELGYIEGQNIVFEYRYAEGKQDRYPELAAELVRLKVDIIVAAGGGRVILAAKNATKTIPIVMVGAGLDPVKAGMIESLARPGGNVTGLSILTTELGGKRLEMLKEAVPKLARVAVLYEPAVPASVLDVKEVLPAAAHGLKLTIQPWEVRAAEDFDKVFAGINKQRPDGLYLAPSTLININLKRIASFALRSRLPSVYSQREFVEAGGLMSYTADLAESYRRVAYYVDRILKGTKPADLPVEQPMKFELVINLKTAKQIGLIIPQSLLYRADKVIKEASAKAGGR